MSQEQETGLCQACGYPQYAGHNPECPKYKKVERKEIEKPLEILTLGPNDEKRIRDYYVFELNHGFSQLRNNHTVDDMVRFRKKQMSENRLKAAIAKEGDELIATSEIVLVKGTKGKDIQDDEAWASGTLVRPDKRSFGIGEKMVAWQDQIAKEAGKKYIRTAIAQKNPASVRLRMKVGYELNGVTVDPHDGEVDFQFKKDLSKEPEKKNWVQEVESSNLKEEEALQNSSDKILINPDDVEKVRKAVDLGYKGKSLLRSEDFEEKKIEKNFIVFVREIKPSS